MKKLSRVFMLIISIILLYSCAKPTVVNVVLPGDEKLNCEQLENEVTESQNEVLSWVIAENVILKNQDHHLT